VELDIIYTTVSVLALVMVIIHLPTTIVVIPVLLVHIALVALPQKQIVRLELILLQGHLVVLLVRLEHIIRLQEIHLVQLAQRVNIVRAELIIHVVQMVDTAPQLVEPL